MGPNQSRADHVRQSRRRSVYAHKGGRMPQGFGNRSPLDEAGALHLDLRGHRPKWQLQLLSVLFPNSPYAAFEVRPDLEASALCLVAASGRP